MLPQRYRKICLPTGTVSNEYLSFWSLVRNLGNRDLPTQHRMLTTRWELWVDLQDSSDLKRTALELFILPIWDLRSKRMGGFWGFKLFNVVPKVKNTEFCSKNADTSATSLQKYVKIVPKTFRSPFRHHATDTIFVNDQNPIETTCQQAEIPNLLI